MARRSAINPVARAVLAAVNVASVRALCQGGVSRNRHRKQAPPYVSIGPCSEEPDDSLGLGGYGALVTVPCHVITTGADENGDERGAIIAEALIARLDEPAVLTVTGWTVRRVDWVGTAGEIVQFEDGAVGYDTAATFMVAVRESV